MDSMGFKYLFYFCFECDLFKLSSIFVCETIFFFLFGQFYKLILIGSFPSLELIKQHI